MENLKEKILEQFQPINFENWKELAQKSIRNRNIDELLKKQLTSNICIDSIYDKSQVEKYFEIDDNDFVSHSITISSRGITNTHCESDIEVALIMYQIIKGSYESVNVEVLIDSNFFLSIAKFRAMCYLLQERFGKNYSIIAQSSHYNKSITDNENNLIRLTIEAISAITGCANKINLSPFNSLTSDDEFGKRVTNNILNILENESYMGIVKDPLSGSFLLENMTNNFIESVSYYLDKFISFKNESELLGYVKDKNEKVKKRDLEALSNQSKKLIGVNVYQNNQDKIEKVPTDNERLSIPFEGLKKKVDELNPRVYIANFEEQNTNQNHLIVALNTFNIPYQISGAFELIEDAYNSIKLYDPDLVIVNGNESIFRILNNMLGEYNIVSVEKFGSKLILENIKLVMKEIEGGN